VLLREHDFQKQLAVYSIIRLCAEACHGTDLDMFREHTAAVVEAAPDWVVAQGLRYYDAVVMRIGILCGERAWARQIFDRSCGDRYFYGMLRIGDICSVSRDAEDLRTLLHAFLASGIETGLPASVIPLLLEEEGADLGAIRTELLKMIASIQAFSIGFLGELYAVIDIVELVEARHTGFSEPFLPELRRRLLRALEWMADQRRSLFRFMDASLDRYGGNLKKKEIADWRARSSVIRNIAGKESCPAPLPLSVSMLDTITVQEGNAGPQRLRGVRVQTLLATMIVDRMIQRPLSQKEFWRVAAGENDLEKARNVVNMSVRRLRDLLGDDAIITGGETPRLNLDLVQVDLLEADRLVAETHEAVRAGALMRATPALKRALEITRGEVPFPGLYDDFFEAARTDFEVCLRDVVIEVARALLREEDAVGAEMILRQAFDAMPDDEEIADLLRETLMLLDRMTEAERVKMRAREEESIDG
jgi:hypothetical protein